MTTPLRVRFPLALGITVAAPLARADVELKNDGFVDGGTVGVQSGFIANEAGAATLVAPDAGRQLLHVQLIIASSQTVTLKVWDDTAGTVDPGGELMSEDFQVTGSMQALNELTPSTPPTVPARFRVGVVFQTNNVPTIARDDDGTVAGDRNFILADGLGWQRSTTLGLTGDWIIRAIVSGSPPMVDGAANPDAGTGGGGMMMGGGCCQTGQRGEASVVLAVITTIAIRRRRRRPCG